MTTGQRHPVPSKPHTLLIGGGYLGTRLAAHYTSSGHQVDVITRSFSRRAALENLGCRHFARNLMNSRFSFSMKGYGLVILNAAPTVDRLLHSASQRLYVGGTQKIYNALTASGFKGKLIIVGSTSAVGSLAADGSGNSVTMDEETYPGTPPSAENPHFMQFALWRKYAAEYPFCQVFLFSAGIYGPDRHPAMRLLQGLRETTHDPQKWINLIHVDDLMRAVIFAVTRIHRSDFFFVSDGRPIRRKAYYDSLSRRLGLPEVEFLPGPHSVAEQGNRIIGTRLKAAGFQLEHPDYLKEPFTPC